MVKAVKMDENGENYGKGRKAVEVRDITCAYNGHVALKDVSMDVMRGEFVAVMGPNGSGKTTLLRAIAGMVKPVKGEVRVYGSISYMPQKDYVNVNIPMKVWDVVAMSILAKGKKFRWSVKLSEEEKKAVEEALRAVAMFELRNAPFTDLSGGQQQRVLLARSLATKPDILLLDEPFNGVDLPTQEKIINLLSELSNGGITVITVVHNVSPLIHHVSKIALLNKTLIACGKPEEVLTAENTLRAYGVSIPVTVCEEGYPHPLFGDIHG